MATSDQVQQLYITYFGRPADPSGLAYWTADAATPLSVIADGFATTPEFTADITGRTLDQIVNSFYVDLFGRNAEPAGLTFWVNQIQIGNTTIQQAGLEISNAALTPEARGNADNVALTSKIAAADQWTATTAASTEATLAYSGNIGIDAGVNYLLPVVSTATIPTEAATEAQIAALVQSNGSGVGSTLELSIFGDVASDTGTVRLDNNGSIQETSAFRFTAGNQTVNGTANTFSGPLAFADILSDVSTLDEDILNISGITNLALLGDATAGAAGAVTNIENVNLTLTSATGQFSEANVTNVNFENAQAFVLVGSIDGNAGFTMTGTDATSFDSSELTGGTTTDVFTFTDADGEDLQIQTSDIADVIAAGGGDDTIVSAGGNDTIASGGGNDIILSGDGNDEITAGAGSDTINAGAGTNTILDAGVGGDTITHNAASSTVAITVTGNSTVTLNASEAGATATSSGVAISVDADNSTAAVTLTGAALSDTLEGGSGNDTITGGAAADTLTGDAGADAFTYSATNDGGAFSAGSTAPGDTITDFATGTDDIRTIGAFLTASMTGTTASAVNAVAYAAGVDFDGAGTGTDTVQLVAAGANTATITNLVTIADLNAALGTITNENVGDERILVFNAGDGSFAMYYFLSGFADLSIDSTELTLLATGTTANLAAGDFLFA